MPIVVSPITKTFDIKIKHEKDVLVFTFKPLSYKIKSHITGQCTAVTKGEISVDGALQCFLNIKHSLIQVKGLVDEEGNPFKLAFEDNTKQALTDDTVETLLATPIQDELIYSAREMNRALYPDKVRNPVTGQPLKGVEVVKSTKPKKGASRKK